MQKKSVTDYFSLPVMQDEMITATICELAYSVASLVVKNDNKWRLHDGKRALRVRMKDEIFRKKVEDNLISFSKGDILRCKVKTMQWRTEEGLKTEYDVLEVVEHIPVARQALLFED